MALLIGYGAGAINPYLAFESIEDLIAEGMHGLAGIDPHKAVKNYIKACGKGVLKVMSKMGVSTVASYTGAQIFEAIGLGEELVDRYFTGTVSRIGGIDLDEIAAAVAVRHAIANPRAPGGAGPPQARAGWRVPVASRRRVPPVQPRDGVQAPARHAGQALRHLQGVQQQGRRPVAQPGDAARAVPLRDERSRSRSTSTTSNRSSEIVQPLLDRRHVVRIDLGRGARDAGDRDEPDRRQVEHRRGRRGSPTGCTIPSAARRSSRWPPAASASRRSTSPTPTTCRSRWRRAPSPARAASCPVTRCTRGSPRPGTRRPVSA